MEIFFYSKFIVVMAAHAELELDSESDHEDECIVELDNCDHSQATLLQAIIQCKEDEIVRTSSRGSGVLELLEAMQSKVEEEEWKLLGEELLNMVLRCVSGPCERKRVALSQVWRNFHLSRLSSVIRARWNSCISMLYVSPNASKESELTLQLIFKRLMHALVKQMVSSSNKAVKTTPLAGLSEKEENVVRYVAGYMVMKPKKKI